MSSGLETQKIHASIKKNLFFAENGYVLKSFYLVLIHRLTVYSYKKDHKKGMNTNVCWLC